MPKSDELLAITSGFEDRLLAAEDRMMAAVEAMGAKVDEEEMSSILQINGDVGVIEIRGMLTNVNSWINKYLGLVAYDEIRLATAQALDAGVGGLMYLIASPGGRVAGMDGAAELISSVPVPTLAFAEETMASAALFLGIQAEHVLAGRVANVGSVGVMMKIMDYTEKMKKDGIKAERIRSGDLKAPGDPLFKLTAKERELLEGQVMTMAEMFFNVVSEARGIPRPMLDQLDITTGRTFIGEQALQAGLVDSLATFDEAYLKIAGLAKKNVDSRKNRAVF